MQKFNVHAHFSDAQPQTMGDVVGHQVDGAFFRLDSLHGFSFIERARLAAIHFIRKEEPKPAKPELKIFAPDDDAIIGA